MLCASVRVSGAAAEGPSAALWLLLLLRIAALLRFGRAAIGFTALVFWMPNRYLGGAKVRANFIGQQE